MHRPKHRVDLKGGWGMERHPPACNYNTQVSVLGKEQHFSTSTWGMDRPKHRVDLKGGRGMERSKHRVGLKGRLGHGAAQA